MKKGDLVVVWKDFADYALISHAASDPFQLCDHESIMVKGVSGSYNTTHVRHAKFHEHVSSEELGDSKNSGKGEPALRGEQQTHDAIALLKRMKSDYEMGNYCTNYAYKDSINAVLAQQQHA